LLHILSQHWRIIF